MNQDICMAKSLDTIEDNKKLTFFVVQSFQSASVIVLALSVHMVV